MLQVLGKLSRVKLLREGAENKRRVRDYLPHRDQSPQHYQDTLRRVPYLLYLGRAEASAARRC